MARTYHRPSADAVRTVRAHVLHMLDQQESRAMLAAARRRMDDEELIPLDRDEHLPVDTFFAITDRLPRR